MVFFAVYKCSPFAIYHSGVGQGGDRHPLDFPCAPGGYREQRGDRNRFRATRRPDSHRMRRWADHTPGVLPRLLSITPEEEPMTTPHGMCVQDTTPFPHTDDGCCCCCCCRHGYQLRFLVLCDHPRGDLLIHNTTSQTTEQPASPRLTLSRTNRERHKDPL